MSRILIIEDEKSLSRFVELELQHEGYETEVQFNGRSGLDAALNKNFDAILLDLMLPELNGIEVCRRVREAKTTPIIMMTARDSVMDRVSGLDHGQMTTLLNHLPLKNYWRAYVLCCVGSTLKANKGLSTNNGNLPRHYNRKRKSSCSS